MRSHIFPNTNTHTHTHTHTQDPALQSGCSLLQSLDFHQVLDVLYGNDSGRLTHISWSPATVYTDEDNIKLQYVLLLVVWEPDPLFCCEVHLRPATNL